jgi:hypothetical protein
VVWVTSCMGTCTGQLWIHTAGSGWFKAEGSWELGHRRQRFGYGHAGHGRNGLWFWARRSFLHRRFGFELTGLSSCGFTGATDFGLLWVPPEGVGVDGQRWVMRESAEGWDSRGSGWFGQFPGLPVTGSLLAWSGS